MRTFFKYIRGCSDWKEDKPFFMSAKDRMKNNGLRLQQRGLGLYVKTSY